MNLQLLPTSGLEDVNQRRRQVELVNQIAGIFIGLTSLGDYADDTAAATGGVLVGNLYRTGSIIKVRIS